MLVVNFLAGPGAGKSTMAAHLFAELKWRGVAVELVTEYAKDLVWEEAYITLRNQLAVFGEQYRRLERLRGKVNIAITDAALINSLVYNAGNTSDSFEKLVLESFHTFININFFVERSKPYTKFGRVENYRQALDKDEEILAALDEYSIPYNRVLGEPTSVLRIVEQILEENKLQWL